jgi:hypothetical protein
VAAGAARATPFTATLLAYAALAFVAMLLVQ